MIQETEKQQKNQRNNIENRKAIGKKILRVGYLKKQNWQNLIKTC